MFRSDRFYLFFRLMFLNPNNNNCPEPLFWPDRAVNAVCSEFCDCV